MNSPLGSILAQSEETNVLLLIGVGICAGAIGAKLVQKLRIPKIVGYILIGVILGPACGIISEDTIGLFEPFNTFALGMVALLIMASQRFEGQTRETMLSVNVAGARQRFHRTGRTYSRLVSNGMGMNDGI